MSVSLYLFLIIYAGNRKLDRFSGKKVTKMIFCLVLILLQIKTWDLIRLD